MSTPRPAPSPWGEPVRTPAAGAQPVRTAEPGRAAGGAAPRVIPRAAAVRWAHPTPAERARAALTMVFVAIVLGAAAAGVLGVCVWVLAALFHHAASG